MSDNNDMPLSTWVHFAVTYDASTTTLTLYRDGSNVKSLNNYPTWSGSSGGLSIGTFTNLTTTTHLWPGYLDDVVVYNRALNQSEVQSLMAGNLTQ